MLNPRPRLEYDLPSTFECTCDADAIADAGRGDVLVFDSPRCRCGDEPEEREDDDAYDRWRDSRDDDGRWS